GISAAEESPQPEPNTEIEPTTDVEKVGDTNQHTDQDAASQDSTCVENCDTESQDPVGGEGNETQQENTDGTQEEEETKKSPENVNAIPPVDPVSTDNQAAKGATGDDNQKKSTEPS